MSHNDEEWSLHKGGDLNAYRIAIRPGDRVRLKKSLTISDHNGEPTGEMHPVGEVWTVLRGCAREPDVIWLREPNGNSHTWSDDDFFNWFEIATDVR